MNLHIPLWLIQSAIALLAMIVFLTVWHRYKEHPRYGQLAFAVAFLLLFLGMFWLVGQVWVIIGGEV